jgi:hypothetical protein
MPRAAATTRTAPPERVAALNAAAALLASAALLNATGDAEYVCVTVGVTGISIQIPATGHLDEAARAAIVATHANILATTVARRPLGPTKHFIEAHGTMAGHAVHVWTTTDPTEPGMS